MVSRLEDLCAFQVAILHASEQAVKEEILGLFYSDGKNHIDCKNGDDEWYPEMNTKVWKTLSKFNVLRNKIPVSVIVFCIMQSAEWAKFHKKKFGLPFKYGYYFLRSSFFTSSGMINKEMAAKVLVNDKDLSCSFRFCIACYYSLTDAIHVLWRQLPEKERPLINNGKYVNCIGIGADNEMVSLWTHYMRGNNHYYVTQNCSFQAYIFKTAVLSGSEVAAQKYWKELNEDERCKMIRFCSKIFFDELTCEKSIRFLSEEFQSYFKPLIGLIKFLLLNSNRRETELLVFSYNSSFLFKMLYYFLHWPYQDIFMRTVHEFREILKVNEYYNLLQRIVSFMYHQFSYNLYDYYVLFRNFWNLSPPSFKRYFFAHEAPTENRDDAVILVHYFDNIIKSSFSIIQKLFYLPCQEKEDIIRLVLGSATPEEKLNIVRIFGQSICVSALEVSDLRMCNLFIECCVLQERIIDFKKNIIYNEKICYKLKTLILSDQLDQVQNILNWALDDKGIKNYMQKLSSSVSPHEIPFLIEAQKFMDKSLKSILTSEEIKIYNKKLIADSKSITDYCLKKFCGDFTCIDDYLDSIFSSEKEISEYKECIAFSGICDRELQRDYFELSQGFEKFENFLKWAKFSQEKCREFKERYIFNKGFIDAFSNVLIQQKFYRIDEFLEWTELPKERVKTFKSNLLFYNQTWISTICRDLLMNNKRDCINGILEWAELSEEETKKFYLIMLEKLDLTEFLTDGKTKFDNLINILSELPLSEEEMKCCKKTIGFNSFIIVGIYVMEKRWNEVKTLLKWCFSSELEILSFKAKNILNIQEQCLELIKSKKFEDVDSFLLWTGFSDNWISSIMDKILFNNETFRMVARILVDGKGEDKRLLDHFFKKDNILLNRWKKDFFIWCNSNKEKERCFYCDISSELSKCLYCWTCKSLNPRKKDIKAFNDRIDNHINNINNTKRQLEEASEERYCKLIKSNQGNDIQF